MKQERAKKKSGENGFGFGRHVSLKQNQHQHVFVGVIFAYLELLRFFLQVGVTFASWGYFCKHMLFEHFMHLQLFVCSLRGQEQKATHVVTVRNEQVNKRYKHAHTQNMFRNRTVFYTESSHSFHSKQQETRSKQETREEPRHLLILGFTSSCSAVILEVLGILLLVAPPTLLVLLLLLLLLLRLYYDYYDYHYHYSTTTTTAAAMEGYTLYSHGRLYVRNLPHWWSWWDTARWVNSFHFPPVGFVKMFYGQDLASCYLHWTRVSRGQLLTYKEALENKVLDDWRRDRRTIVKVTVDNYGPPQVPTPPAVPLPPEVPSNSSSSTTTDPSTSTRKRPLEATWLGLLCQFCAFWQFFGQVFKMHTGSCRGQGRRWPYHGFIRSSNLAQTCDCCSIPISCPLCL